MIELRLEHPPLEGNPNTILTEQANAGATSIKVANNFGFSENDFIVIGNPGSEFTEIVRISSLSGNDTINLATTLKFSHFYSSPVTLIYYDKIEVERADVKAGPYTLLATIDIAIDEDFTTYRDETGDIDKFYRIRYKNSYSNKTSAYSSPLAGSGFTENSVRILLEKAKRLFSGHSDKLLDREVWMNLLNEGYQEMINRIISLNKDFGVKRTEITLTAGENTYNLPSDFLTLRRLYVDWGDGNLYPARYLDLGIYEPVRQTFIETHPFYRFEAGKIVIYPTPKRSGGKLVFYYYYQPAKLQFDDDVLDTNYILPTYASIVIEYVLKRALELDKRYEEANWYGQIFENRIGQLLEIYENRYKEATETIPFWGSDFDTSFPFH
jgi:hypothetical protein